MAANGQTVLKDYLRSINLPQPSTRSSQPSQARATSSGSVSATSSTQPNRLPSQESMSRRVPSLPRQPEQVASSRSSTHREQAQPSSSAKADSRTQLGFNSSSVDNATNQTGPRTASSTRQQWAEGRVPATTKSSLRKVPSAPNPHASPSSASPATRDQSFAAMASAAASSKSLSGSRPKSATTASSPSQPQAVSSQFRQSREADIAEPVDCESSTYHRESNVVKAIRSNLDSLETSSSKEASKSSGPLQFNLSLETGQEIPSGESKGSVKTMSSIFRGATTSSPGVESRPLHFASPYPRGIDEFMRATWYDRDTRVCNPHFRQPGTSTVPAGHRDFFSDEDEFDTPASVSSVSQSTAQNELLIWPIKPQAPAQPQEPSSSVDAAFPIPHPVRTETTRQVIERIGNPAHCRRPLPTQQPVRQIGPSPPHQPHNPEVHSASNRRAIEVFRQEIGHDNMAAGHHFPSSSLNVGRNTPDFIRQAEEPQSSLPARNFQQQRAGVYSPRTHQQGRQTEFSPRNTQQNQQNVSFPGTPPQDSQNREAGSTPAHRQGQPSYCRKFQSPDNRF